MKVKLPILILVFLLIGHVSKSQVLISLLLGDKLNTGKIEFGLEGGFNYSSFHNLDVGNRSSDLNLGFYFLLKMGENTYLNTGVLVKQSQGAKDLDTYVIGDPQIDDLFVDGTMLRRINYFQTPINFHYRTPIRVYFEGGVQVSLRHSARDFFFETTLEEDDTQFKIDTKANYTTIDAGLLGGLGYKLKDREGGIPGMSIGAKYYYGLVDVLKNDTEELFNDSFYVYVRIPIGAGKAAKKANAEQ